MKPFEWNEEKNRWLKENRNVSFDQVHVLLQLGKIVAIIESQGRYPGQRSFVIEIDGYAYQVPFIESETRIVLKTIFPSRKLTRRYLRNEDHGTD